MNSRISFRFLPIFLVGMFLSGCGYNGPFLNTYHAKFSTKSSPVGGATQLELFAMSDLSFSAHWTDANGKLILKEHGRFKQKTSDTALAESQGDANNARFKWKWEVSDSKKGVFTMTRNGVSFTAYQGNLPGSSISQTKKSVVPKTTRQKQSKVQFEKIVLDIVKNRKKLTPVSEQLRSAPTDCIAVPAGGRVVKTMTSKSDDVETHGKKLYHLYVKNLADYQKVNDSQRKTSGKRPVHVSPVGQTLIKDSFHANSAENKGEVPMKRYAYFVMTKLDPKTPGTDQGWIYATVDPAAEKVMAVDKLESCMSCHQTAIHDRLFGFQDVQNQNSKK